MSSQRQLRVGEELRHALSEIINRGDSREAELLDVNITVSEVRVSPDLGNATAFVMPLGGKNKESILAALRRAAPHFRRGLARAVQLRHVPELQIELDHSFDYASKITTLLDTLPTGDRLALAPTVKPKPDEGK